MKLISLVVPVYFEEEVILQFLKETAEVLDALEGYDYEYVFVDDGSKDKTVNILRQEAKLNPRISVIVFSYNHGKAAAITAAIDHAKGDYYLYMDPDLQDPPKEIPKFVKEMENGYDLVWGIRERKADTLINTLFSKLFWYVLNKFTGLDIPTGIAVMRMFNKPFAQEFVKYRESNRFIEGIFLVISKNWKTIPISQRNRFAGKSKFNFKRKMNLAFDAIFDFSELPLKLAVRMGAFLIFFSFLSLFCLIILELMFVNFQSGWPSIIAVTLLGFGILLFFIGLTSIYIGRIYKEVKRRPLYSVKEIIGIEE